MKRRNSHVSENTPLYLPTYLLSARLFHSIHGRWTVVGSTDASGQIPRGRFEVRQQCSHIALSRARRNNPVPTTLLYSCQLAHLLDEQYLWLTNAKHPFSSPRLTLFLSLSRSPDLPAILDAAKCHGLPQYVSETAVAPPLPNMTLSQHVGMHKHDAGIIACTEPRFRVVRGWQKSEIKQLRQSPPRSTMDEAQVRRAASALLKHIKNSSVGKPSLMGDEGEVVLAQISLHKIPGNVTAKPIPIAIPHPLRQRDDCDMCLIVKDNAKTWIKEMVEEEPVEGLTKVSPFSGTFFNSSDRCDHGRTHLKPRDWSCVVSR